MNYWLLLIPILSALVGWVTISIAIWLLFHPLQTVKVFGVGIQGAWPANREKIAAKAGAYAASLFLGNRSDRQTVPSSGFEEVRPVIEQHMDHFLRHKLQEQMPMIATFIGEKTMQSLKQIFIAEIELLFPEIIGKLAGGAGNGMNIEAIISQKMAAIPQERIKEVVGNQFNPAFKKARLLGIVIGLVIGLLQLFIALVS